MTQSTSNSAVVDLFPVMEEGYQQLRAFIDCIEMPVAFVDQHFEIVKMNKSYHLQAGKDYKALVGGRVFSLFPSLGKTPEPLKDFFHSDQVEVICNALDHSGQVYHLTLRKFADDKGRKLAIIVIHQIHFNDDLLQQLLRERGDYLGLVESIDSLLESPSDELFATAAQQAVKLTQSEIGYLHFYDDKSRQVLFNTWSDGESSMSSSIDDHFVSLHEAGAWMDCVRNSRPAIHNNYCEHQGKKGFTNGHYEIHQSLSVPVVYERKVVAVLGVANSKAPYTESDGRLLKLFSTVMWHAAEMPRMFERILHQTEMLKKQRSQISRSLFDLIGAISETLELKDVYTSGHQKSVSKLSVSIGLRLGLSRFELEGLKLGALVHDIGKIGIPSDILSKPSRLSPEEYALIKTHSTLGAEVLHKVKFPWPIREMILQHHERLDGSGYPKGLKGEEIIKEARIIAVADVCDSILSHRPYRPSLGLKELKSELQLGRGTKYQAEIVDACFEVLEHEEVVLNNVLGRLPLLSVAQFPIGSTLSEVLNNLQRPTDDYVAVMDGESVVGLIEHTVVEKLKATLCETQENPQRESKLLNSPIEEYMTHCFSSVTWDCFIDDALEKMKQENCDYLLVLSSKGEPTGILTWRIVAEAKQRDNIAGSCLLK